MKEKISSKITALTFGVLVLVFAIGFLVFAWTEPTQTPPGGNVPTPINVGTTPQTKEGQLTIAAGGGDALVIKNGGDLRIYTPDNAGSALLYVDNNGELTTSDNLKVGSVTIKKDGTVSPNLNSDKLDDYHAADLMASGGGGVKYWEIVSTNAWDTGFASAWYGHQRRCVNKFPDSIFFTSDLLNSAFNGGPPILFNLYQGAQCWFGVRGVAQNPNGSYVPSNWTSNTDNCYGYSAGAGSKGWMLGWQGVFFQIGCEERGGTCCAIPH